MLSRTLWFMLSLVPRNATKRQQVQRKQDSQGSGVALPSLHPTEAVSQAQWFHVAGVCPRDMLPGKSNLPLQGQLCLGRRPACGRVSTIRHVSQPSHNLKNTRRLHCRCMPRHSTAIADSNKTVEEQSQQLPAELVQARQVKALGTQASAAILGVGLTVAWFQGFHMPNVAQWSVTGLACCVCLGAVVIGLAATNDKAQIELHEGRLYIQWGAPSTGPLLAEGAIEVRPTGDGRGNGAFALQHITAGTYLGDYEGDMLDEASYWARYPSGMADYCIKVDREWSIDGRDRAANTSRFSPCHMNHSGSRQNVVRSTKRQQRKVSFFTQRDLQVGEELLLDYGSTYWKTREDQMLE